MIVAAKTSKLGILGILVGALFRGRNIRILFGLRFNASKAPTLCANVMIWIVNISATVTQRTDEEAIFLGVENLLVHLAPPAKANEDKTSDCNANSSISNQVQMNK